jgi:hypothetical protein
VFYPSGTGPFEPPVLLEAVALLELFWFWFYLFASEDETPPDFGG